MECFVDVFCTHSYEILLLQANKMHVKYQCRLGQLFAQCRFLHNTAPARASAEERDSCSPRCGVKNAWHSWGMLSHLFPVSWLVQTLMCCGQDPWEGTLEMTITTSSSSCSDWQWSRSSLKRCREPIRFILIIKSWYCRIFYCRIYSLLRMCVTICCMHASV